MKQEPATPEPKTKDQLVEEQLLSMVGNIRISAKNPNKSLYENTSRGQFMEDIQAKIDRHNRENMQRLCKGDYDEVMDPFSIDSKQKISKYHSYILKLQRLATLRNIMILGVMLFMLVWQVLPRMKYTALTFDKFYFGFFVEKVPELALTTTHKNYMIANNKPFRTTVDINKGNREYEERLAMDIEHPWNEEYYAQPSVHSVLKGKLQSGLSSVT